MIITTALFISLMVAASFEARFQLPTTRNEVAKARLRAVPTLSSITFHTQALAQIVGMDQMATLFLISPGDPAWEFIREKQISATERVAVEKDLQPMDVSEPTILPRLC